MQRDRGWFPGRSFLPRRDSLGTDGLAGLVLIAFLIPAGMGYAQVAGLPPETGLYATVVPMLAYAIVGPSPVLVLGPDSSLAPIIAAAVLPLAAGNPDRAVALAGLLAIMMGAILVAGGAGRLGFVTDLLSKPIRIGYLVGVAVTVIVGQTAALLGFSVKSGSVVSALRATIRGLGDGRVEPIAATVGIAALVVLTVVRTVNRRLPGPLAVVVASTVAVWAAGWKSRLPVAGRLVGGLPRPALTSLHWDDVRSLALPALGIALVAFADTAVLSRTMAARRGATVDAGQEMAAVGAANVAGGLLGGFPVCASATRTPLAIDAGARSQLSGIVAAVGLMGFILLTPGVTGYLPRSVLAAVIIVAAATLVDLKGLRVLWRTDRLEAALCAAAFLGVTLVGVLGGIGIAIALSFVAFINQAWHPYRAELGRVTGLRGYHDVTRFPQAKRLPELVLLRFDAPLFFANASFFTAFVRHAADRAAPGLRWVILAAEPITSIDTTAADELAKLDDLLHSRGITLLLAELKDPVKDQLSRLGLAERFAGRFPPTVGAAVDKITGTFRGDLEPGP